MKIKNLEDLKDYSERIRDYARVGNIYIHKNKKNMIGRVLKWKELISTLC